LLSATAYLLAAAELTAVLVAAGFGAARVRARLLPGWTGPPARLADAVLAAALLLWIGELLGTVGLFEELPYAIAVVAAGAALRALVWAPGAAGGGRALPPAPPATALTAVALAAAGLVVAHWSIGVRLSLDSGITNFDSTWYHGPFAALFAQSGSTFDLEFIAPQFLAWFYPANSELWHAIGIVAFDRDLLSPLLNVVWAAGTLLAAWCVGRPHRVAPLSMLGVAAVLVSGSLADQAGSMRNDIPAIFFLLSAVAIAVNAAARDRDGLAAPGPLVLVGLAAGLAAGIKLNYLAPAAALALGLVVAAPSGRRGPAAAALGLPLLAGCGYWYLRNLVHSGNPLPWVKSLGPVSLPAPTQELGGREQHSVLSYLFDGSVWDDWFLPGLHHGLGALWPLLVALALAGLALCIKRGRPAHLRALGVAGLVAIAAWAVGPASASGPEGTPLGFESGLRYLAPGLVVGLALLPVAAGPLARSPLLLLALLAALVSADASGLPWYSGYVLGAVAIGVAAAAAFALLGWSGLGKMPRPAVAAGAALVVALAVAAGWAEQRRYLDHRYADPGFAAPGLNAAFEWARDLDGRRIATIATREYPLFGTELGNEVEFAGVRRPHGGFVRATSCEQWRRLLNRGDYDYVVASGDRVEQGAPAYPREARWTAGPETSELLREPPTVVFRVDAPLPPAGCRRPPPG
jgi:hypothetical protein